MFYAPWLTRSAHSYIARQKEKTKNSKHFFCSKVAGFGPRNYCCTKIVLNHRRFPMRSQSS